MDCQLGISAMVSKEYIVSVGISDNTILIPLYGAVGAAMALVASQFFVNYGVLGFRQETRHLLNMETKAFKNLVYWKSK